MNFIEKNEPITVAPAYAVFDITSTVNAKTVHTLHADVDNEKITVSDTAGGEIVISAANVRNLVNALESAVALVDIHITQNKQGDSHGD